MILPETVYREGRAEVPTGPNISIRPIYPEMTGSVTGNASITAGPPVPTQNFRLEIDKLPANARFSFAFYTVVPEQTMPYKLCKFLDNFADPEQMDTHKECHFYLEGCYQFLLRGEYVPSPVFVPLLFRANERTVKSYPVQDTTVPWKIWRVTLGSGARLTVGGPR